jgi:sulfopyruvate decarboxylase TPP-binding subunit
VLGGKGVIFRNKKIYYKVEKGTISYKCTTPCKNMKGIMVGSDYCAVICKHFKKINYKKQYVICRGK